MPERATTSTIFLFLLLGIIWGSAFVGIEILVHHFLPWLGAALRLAVAVVSLFIIVKVRGRSFLLPKGTYLKTWGLGLLAVGIPFSLLFWGEQRVSGGLAGIINGTVPLWMTVFFIFAPDRKTAKRLSPSIVLGVVLGFLGLIIIFYPRLSIPSGHAEFLGALAVLGMALSYSVANLLNRKLLTQTEGLKIDVATFHQHLSSFVYLLILSFTFETWPNFESFSSNSVVWLAILYLGVFPSAFAFIIYFYLLKKVGAIKTGAVTYFIPLIAIAFDFIVQGHKPGASVLFGMIFILTGLFFIRSSKPV